MTELTGNVQKIKLLTGADLAGGVQPVLLVTGTDLDGGVQPVEIVAALDLPGGVMPATLVSGADLPGNVMRVKVLQDSPTVLFNFMSGYLDPRVEFTRSSVGYFFNSSGLLEAAPIDVPRFDYGYPGSTTLQGLLIEGGATNQALWNRDLTNAAWVKTNITPALNQTGIDGVTNSASSLTATAGNGTALQSVTTGSAARCVSAYVKRLVGSGTIQMTLDNSTWTAVTVTNNWTRVTIPSQTIANPNFGFRIVTSGDSIAVDFVQEEARAAPTSPIPTTTVAVARNLDSAVVKGLNFSEFYNATEGTLLAEWIMSSAQISGTERNVVSMDNDTANERICILANNGSNVSRGTVTDGGVTQAALLGSAVTVDTVHKATVAYKVNDFAAYLDGGTISTDTVGTIPTPTQIRIGSRYNSTTSQLYGHIRAVSYWNSRKDPSLLQGITL